MSARSRKGGSCGRSDALYDSRAAANAFSRESRLPSSKCWLGVLGTTADDEAAACGGGGAAGGGGGGGGGDGATCCGGGCGGCGRAAAAGALRNGGMAARGAGAAAAAFAAAAADAFASLNQFGLVYQTESRVAARKHAAWVHRALRPRRRLLR